MAVFAAQIVVMMVVTLVKKLNGGQKEIASRKPYVVHPPNAMASSKCTRSLCLSVWPRRLPLWCVVEYIRHLEVRRVTSLTRFVLFLLFVF